MEAKECKVQDILTENKKYLIPAYQRPYSWSKDNAEQLIDDIYQSYACEEKEYFIGSMICLNQGNNSYEVVDGQQRLTTLSLILAQLKFLIDHQGVSDDLQKRILPIDVYSDETDEPRLVVRKKEYSLYKHYILQNKLEYKPEKPTDTESVFLENYRVIGDYLKKFNEQELKKLAQYILQKVFIVFVQTDDLASSFRLFNVLNSRGLPLSNADLLKNMLFEASANSNNNSIENQVKQDWSEIEDIVGINNLDKFLTLHKISEKKDRDRVLEKGLDSFINSLKNDFNNRALDMTRMLLHSAKNYCRLIEAEFRNPKVKSQIKSLNHLNNRSWFPPMMAFLNRMISKQNLDWDEFSAFVKIFEKVFMQGFVKKMVISQREMVCYSALVAINNSQTFNTILESVTNHADNEGFSKALNEDMYEPRPNQVNLIKTILLRLDSEQQDKSVIKTYTGRITIEHILPQKISNAYWLDRYKIEEHEKWLHKIGNLTLISGSKNSEAQNSGFQKKKMIYEKLNNRSSFDITKDVCNYNEWDLDSLKDRHKKITTILKKLWTV